MITGSAARASCGQRRLASVLNSHSSVSACFEVGSYRLCLKASLLSSELRSYWLVPSYAVARTLSKTTYTTMQEAYS